MKKKQGFTLVEIMIVVAIIGILAAIAIPSFQRSRQTTRANACVNNLRLIEAATEQWGMATGAENTDVPDLTLDLAEYIRGGVPTCPENGAYEPAAMGTTADPGTPNCTHTLHGTLADYLADPTNWNAFN